MHFNFTIWSSSGLGPRTHILFTNYTLPNGDIVRTHGLNVHFYADDTRLYVLSDPIDHEDTTSIPTQVENCIAGIRIWMVENNLKLNDDNTEVIMDDFVKHICKAAYFHLHNI